MTAPTRLARPAEKGSALIIVLVVVAILATLVLAMSVDTQVELTAAVNREGQLKAFYMAEAGAQRAMAELGGNFDWRGAQTATGWAFAPGDNGFDLGTYWVTVTAYDQAWGDFGAKVLYVTSEGKAVRGIRRKVRAVVTPSTVKRPFLEWSYFGCSKLRFSDGNDSITGGKVYAGNGLDLMGGTITDADLWIQGVATIGLNGFVEQNLNASSHIDPLGVLAIQVGGNATAGGTVKDPSKVAGTSTSNLNVVKDYCNKNSPDYLPFMNMQRPLTDAEIYDIITDAGAGVVTHNGGWDVTTSTLLTGTHNVKSGSFKSTAGVNLTYSGHTVLIVQGGSMEFEGTNIALDAAADPANSSLTLITTSGKILFGAGTNANFNGVVHAGVIDTTTTPPTMAPAAHCKSALGATVSITGSIFALGNDSDMAGAVSIGSTTVVPPVFTSAGSGVMLRAWREEPVG